MKKQLPEDMITNELKGRSAFFLPQTEQKRGEEQSDRVRTPERVNARTPVHTNARTGEQANGRIAERPKSSSGKRVIKRQSYNVYQDQHEALQRLEATGVLSGNNIFISEMVREALDEYLSKHQ